MTIERPPVRPEICYASFSSLRHAARMGTRRFGTRAYVAVRPTTATFSSYANFVNMLFSRLSYPSPMPLCRLALAAERKTRRAFPKAIIRDNQPAVTVLLRKTVSIGPREENLTAHLRYFGVRSMRGRMDARVRCVKSRALIFSGRFFLPEMLKGNA